MISTDVTVRAVGLHKSFASNPVLRGIDLQVTRGEVVVVMGPSGSGKTTLVRCLNLLEEPDAGRVEVCGVAVDFGEDRPARREYNERARRIRTQASMVFQAFNLFPHKTALENVTEGPIVVKKMSRPDANALGEKLLSRVGLADKFHEYPSRLSGGQKQRVAIARALAMEPQVILFDEPTSALDPELHEEVLQVMRELARDGMTMIVVTHEVRFARDAAQRVVFMDGGVILEQSAPELFFTHPSSERARQFLRLVSA